MNENTKLYFVTLTGLHVAVSIKSHGNVYVLSEDTEQGCQNLKEYLAEKEIHAKLFL